jgi:hypothetical protein
VHRRRQYYTALIKTSKGDLTVQFDPVKAPGTVNNFVSLALTSTSTASPVTASSRGFVVQCGDPSGTGTGGPGYKIADELPKAGEYKLGSLAWPIRAQHQRQPVLHHQRTARHRPSAELLVVRSGDRRGRHHPQRRSTPRAHQKASPPKSPSSFSR